MCHYCSRIEVYLRILGHLKNSVIFKYPDAVQLQNYKVEVSIGLI
jgi:hypothetical protein